MNEIWHRIMKDYIEDYENIKRLAKREVIDEDTGGVLMVGLLEDIIETFKSEVEE